jgi:hypothetical protein
MPLSAHATAIVDAFGHQPGVTPDQLNNLRQTINASPALVDEVNRAVAAGHLQRIVPLNNPNAGGEYAPGAHEMRLPLHSLTTPAGGRFDAGEPTFVLGHELQHGFNAADTARARAKFDTDLQAVAQSPNNVHDYTRPIGDLIAVNRRDEARAQISGWNATVSAAREDARVNHSPAPTLQDIYNRNPGRMGDFIKVDNTHMPPTYAMRPNLAVKPDLTMASTPGNIEGQGKNYFDKGATLGHKGNSTYANYYGSVAVGRAVEFERYYGQAVAPAGHAPATMAVNLKSLHLDPRIMAENGINLGSNHQAMPYSDTSTAPPTVRHFRQSDTTHTYVPIVQGAAPSARLDHPDHPDHALYMQSRDAVHRLDAQQGRVPDVQSDQFAASAAVAARANGMTRVDHVALSDDASRAYAVQGALNSPHKQVAEMQTVQAVNAPIEQSSRDWATMAQQQAVEKPTPPAQTQAPPLLAEPQRDVMRQPH